MTDRNWMQEGTPGDEIMWATAAMADGGVVLAGDVSGNYTEDNFGKIDFVAVKLNSEGILQWRWRVRFHRLYDSLWL